MPIKPIGIRVFLCVFHSNTEISTQLKISCTEKNNFFKGVRIFMPLKFKVKQMYINLNAFTVRLVSYHHASKNNLKVYRQKNFFPMKICRVVNWILLFFFVTCQWHVNSRHFHLVNYLHPTYLGFFGYGLTIMVFLTRQNTWLLWRFCGGWGYVLRKHDCIITPSGPMYYVLSK